MIIASLNCNKRLGNPKALALIHEWLCINHVDLFLAQEPWSNTRVSPVNLPSYSPLGGNSKVFTWIKNGQAINSPQLIESYWQLLYLDYLVIHNVYLDAYQQITRGDQLAKIKEGLGKVGGRPQIIVGDFNLAPKPEDGLSGERPSKFNGPEDRNRLDDLIKNEGLVDTTCRDVTGGQEFSISRIIKKTQIRFRCDLCLVSDYLFATEAVSVKYDHSVRNPVSGFSDHSALILNLPVTLAPKQSGLQDSLFPLESLGEDDQEFEFCHHKTAMARNSPSTVARLICEGEFITKLDGIKRILDFGCGRGKDVDFYRSKGFDVEGYDPYIPFGFANPPQGIFDLVTIVFVINVLPNCWERLQVIKKAVEYLRRGGYIFLAARSSYAIGMEAQKKGWRQHNDGYWSHEGRGTFQRGINTTEIIALAKRAGLMPHPLSDQIKFDSTVSHLLAVKS